MNQGANPMSAGGDSSKDFNTASRDNLGIGYGEHDEDTESNVNEADPDSERWRRFVSNGDDEFNGDWEIGSGGEYDSDAKLLADSLDTSANDAEDQIERKLEGAGSLPPRTEKSLRGNTVMKGFLDAVNEWKARKGK